MSEKSKLKEYCVTVKLEMASYSAQDKTKIAAHIHNILRESIREYSNDDSVLFSTELDISIDDVKDSNV